MQKLRVGVLMGGRSQEREVSLNSGRTICDHLDTLRYAVVPLFQSFQGILYVMPQHFLHRGKISDFEHRLASEAQAITWDDLKAVVDFLYIAQHGRFAEDGRLQGLLEVLRIPYCGSKVLTSALGMDKIMQKTFLREAGICVPDHKVILPHEVERVDEQNFTLPCIVKPAHEGSSIGVTVVRSRDEIKHAIIEAATVTPGIVQPVVVEELITGMEFSCIVIFDYVQQKYVPLPISEVVITQGSDFFDYEQKYMPGKAIKHTPARCTNEQRDLIHETCIKTMRALNITTIGRIDGFLTPDNRVFIIDPNTFCGMDPASFAFLQAAEINMSNTQLINHLIETELYNYGLLKNVDGQFFADTGDNDTNSVSKSGAAGEKKIRVAVLLGGRSNEREISLVSGRNIVYKLSPHKYDVLPLFVDSHLELYKIDQRLLVRNTTSEIEEELKPEMKILWSELPAHVDFVFIGLHGGEGENGCVQGALETLGLPYNGSSVLASALCMDKFKTNRFLKSRGLAVPEGVLLMRDGWDSSREIKVSFGYPCVIKPHDDGCSVLVQKANNSDELREAVAKIFAAGKTGALIEEYVRGVELTVGVVGNQKPYALPPSMAVAQAGILSIEEKFLPGAGENQTPAPLPSEVLALVQRAVEAAYAAVGCKGYARIDCFYQPAAISPTGEDRAVILEINTLPGMTPATCIFHQAAEIGLRPMDFVDLIIKLGFEEHAPHFLTANSDVLGDSLGQLTRSAVSVSVDAGRQK